MAVENPRSGECYLCSLAGVAPMFAGEEFLAEVAIAVAGVVSVLGEAPLLVHGYPVLAGGPYEGMRYGHAWIEFPGSGLVLSTLEMNLVPLAVYYRAGQVEEEHVRRYTFPEAHERALATGTAGPWHDYPGEVAWAD